MPEIAITFDCEGHKLVGILHLPERPVGDLGVLIVVGGPQYRVGSHRQFVLLARHLAGQGTPVMRFDYRGMGDSEGQFAGFEQIDADIRAALDVFQGRVPGTRRLVLWGLCDGASAAVMYASSDLRVEGLVLVNPWVRTEAGLAQSYLKNYYAQRFLSRAFWGKVIKHPGSLWTAARELLVNLVRARSGDESSGGTANRRQPFLHRMVMSKQRFHGSVLVLLSGDDLVAAEYRLLLGRDAVWATAFEPPLTKTRELAGANHTFSRELWRAWVETATAEFVEERRRARD